MRLVNLPIIERMVSKIFQLFLCALLIGPLSLPGIAFGQSEKCVWEIFSKALQSVPSFSFQTVEPHRENASSIYDFASGFHKYLYAHNNPVNMVDPSGQSGFSIGGVLVGIYVRFTLSTTAFAASSGALAETAALVTALGIYQNYQVLSTGRDPETGETVGAAGVGLAIVDSVPGAGKLLGQPIRITFKGLKHVLDRHSINNIVKWAHKSKFNAGEDVAKLIERGTHQPMSKQANGNFARTFDVGSDIGVDMTTGKQTSIMTIITRADGELVTAFPGAPNMN